MDTITTLTRLLALAITLLAGGPAAAQPTPGVGPERALKIKPVMLEGNKTTGATLGLEYTYERKWTASGSTDDGPGDKFDFTKTVLWDRLVEVRGAGTIAVSRERNPNKLLDLAVNARYDVMPSEKWSAGAGASLKAETDQSFEDRQFVYALQLRGFLNNPIGNGWGIAYLNFGRVDPKNDEQRKRALGAEPEHYRRWDAEIVIHRDLKGSIGKLNLKSLEMHYRHFQEVSATAAIRQAGLHRQRLGAVRLNVGDDYFVAYSRGRLPFDRHSDRAIKLGWSYKLE